VLAYVSNPAGGRPGNTKATQLGMNWTYPRQHFQRGTAPEDELWHFNVLSSHIRANE
jgi:hypothetical protein